MRAEWQILFVALGGALGALSRFGIAQACANVFSKASFPIGTLVANLLGCFLIGLLIGSGSAEKNEQARLGIGVGYLGALTTFSTFGAETIKHVHENEWSLALGNVTANLVLGLAAVAIGIVAGKKLSG